LQEKLFPLIGVNVNSTNEKIVVIVPTISGFLSKIKLETVVNINLTNVKLFGYVIL